MIKGKINGVELKQFSSGEAIQFRALVEYKGANKTARGSMHPNTPDYIFDGWYAALGANPLTIQSVDELRRFIGKEIMVEVKETQYGLEIAKANCLEASEPPPSPGSAPPPPPTSTGNDSEPQQEPYISSAIRQEMIDEDDDIPF